jgi:disulfide bond formation protein DsbB
LAPVPTLPVTAWEEVGVPLQGSLSGLARDPATGRFLVTTDEYGVYLLDTTLSRILHRVVLDRGFSVDLTPLAGAAFMGVDTMAVLSTNKSYAILTPDPQADPAREWRHFLSTDGGVRELRLGRFQTVRAHQMYVLSMAFDPDAREAVTVSIPNPRHRQLVVSRFARNDMVLSSEFEPELGSGLALAGPERALSEYVVTGADVADGKLYAISAAYSTLLVIDLARKEIQAAYGLAGLADPVGLAVLDTRILVAQADGRVAVVERPSDQ